MIIRLECSTTDHLKAAQQNLETMAHQWGYKLQANPTTTPNPSVLAHNGGDKGIDPVSVAALALSIPSAALAVIDLVQHRVNSSGV